MIARVAVAMAGALSIACAAAESVFPGAMGFGIDTPAGSDGAVVRVTNLDADGPGSLRAALNMPGPRLIVFDVGGVIDLARRDLTIDEPFVTVAGQTAPSPGITLIRGGVVVRAHDVLIQHLRVRPGDAGQPKQSGWESDGLTTWGGNAYNIVIDHCSFTWATDENLSVSGPRLQGPQATSRRVTLSHCIIAEGLHDASHAKGPHSKGTLIHDFCRDVAVIGNLYAHNEQRNPYFKAHTTGVIVNNVIYNPGRHAIQLGFSAKDWAESEWEPAPPRVSVVGNVLLHGRDTPPGLPLVTRSGVAYMDDNLALDRDGGPASLADGQVAVAAVREIWTDQLRALPAAETLEYVLHNAGARPWDRDAIDARIVEQVRARQGGIIHSQDEVGGYPAPASATRVLEVPAVNRRAWLAALR